MANPPETGSAPEGSQHEVVADGLHEFYVVANSVTHFFEGFGQCKFDFVVVHLCRGGDCDFQAALREKDLMNSISWLARLFPTPLLDLTDGL